MIAIRDLYYRIENLYLQMLKECDSYVNKLERQRIDKNRIHINEEEISLLTQQIQYVQAYNMDASIANVKMLENKIAQMNSEIVELKKQKVKDEEIQKSISMIIEKVNKISQDMKPTLINYCKSYIDWKKKHKRELRQKGQIQYIKCTKGEEKQT